MTQHHGMEEFEEAFEADVAAVAPAVTLEHERPGPAPAADTPSAPPWGGIAKAMVFPIFFVVMFALCYISAFHHPTPHDVKLALVGPSAQTSMVADQLSQHSDGAFAVSTSTDLSATLDQLQYQKIAGAIELGPTVTAHVASGAGMTVTQTVEKVGQQLASATGTQLVVHDVAPLGGGDGTGMGLFYFMVVCTIGGYLTVTVVSQAAPKLRVRHQVTVLGVMSVLATLIAFGISSIFVGSYGATAAGLTAMVLIGMVYTFAVGLVAMLCNKVLGQAAIFLVMTFAIFLNFPSAGGAIPTGFMPPFWEWLHNFWIGSGVVQAMRSVVYFGGAGVGHGLLIVGLWLAAAAALTGLVVYLKRDRNGGRHEAVAA
ncbi:ABC transporter permease [Rhodococcus sp. D2-41]|uniref:ABC transporter permease n=1 Tax=Speluncibacter jeojiensis TaxID=2710754 RepID=A0A9X4M2P7_9ACTN|nr:hypothetical protein [Rhodococcus sp. D2-41]MDG3010381.1 ABC transporter permease [Rhodococcus sp. D2-41]MDG3014118.1 ABC transporter permease [Corynebacteriales bacterium D3-21]